MNLLLHPNRQGSTFRRSTGQKVYEFSRGIPVAITAKDLPVLADDIGSALVVANKGKGTRNIRNPEYDPDKPADDKNARETHVEVDAYDADHAATDALVDDICKEKLEAKQALTAFQARAYQRHLDQGAAAEKKASKPRGKSKSDDDSKTD